MDSLSQGTIVFDRSDTMNPDLTQPSPTQLPFSFYLVSHTNKESNLSEPTKYTVHLDDVTQRDDVYMNPNTETLIELQTSAASKTNQ